jgi:hypothetical protein
VHHLDRTGGRLNGTTHGYDRDGFLGGFFPDPRDRRGSRPGAGRLVAASRAHRLAEMRA